MRMFTGTFDCDGDRVNYALILEWNDKSVDARMTVAEKDGYVVDEFTMMFTLVSEMSDTQYMRRRMVRKAKGRSKIYY